MEIHVKTAAKTARHVLIRLISVHHALQAFCWNLINAFHVNLNAKLVKDSRIVAQAVGQELTTPILHVKTVRAIVKNALAFQLTALRVLKGKL